MNNLIKVLHTFETRDGEKHDTHEAATRHEYGTAIPVQLAELLLAESTFDLHKADADNIAEVLMANALTFIEILQDFLETLEAVEDMDRRQRQRETANQLLAEKGLSPPQAAIERRLNEAGHA